MSSRIPRVLMETGEMAVDHSGSVTLSDAPKNACLCHRLLLCLGLRICESP